LAQNEELGCVIGILYPTSSDTNADRLRTFRKSLAARAIRHHRATLEAGAEDRPHASKLCILGFEPFKSSLIAELCGFRIRHCQGDMWIRTAPNTVTCKLQAQHILSPA
jgi:hypothetical protein